MHTTITISPPLTLDKDYAKDSFKLIWAKHIDLIQKDLMDTNGTAVEKQEKCFPLAIVLAIPFWVTILLDQTVQVVEPPVD